MLMLLGALFASCTRVTPTEAGFKISNGGNYRGVDSLPLLTGYNFYMPWASQVITIPTTQQHTVWGSDKNEGGEENQEITVSCMGGAGFKMDVGLNWRVDPFKASKIYLKYNTDDLSKISSTYLRNVVRGKMQEISGTMTVDSLLNSLPLFESTVHKELNKQLNSEGFIIDLYNVLKQPTPSDPKLAESIALKVKAKQDAERTKTEEQQTIAQANKDVAKARGDSASAVIRASGEAEAIKKKQEVISATYVEFVKWSQWDGKLPTTSLGNGTPMIYSPK